MRSLTQDASRVPSAPATGTAVEPGKNQDSGCIPQVFLCNLLFFVCVFVLEKRKEPPPRPPAPVDPKVVDVQLPYPAYPQGMPVPYNAAASYSYPPPPMPATYNPYATMPMHSEFIK